MFSLGRNQMRWDQIILKVLKKWDIVPYDTNAFKSNSSKLGDAAQCYVQRISSQSPDIVPQS
jgi:hypothetical protein